MKRSLCYILSLVLILCTVSGTLLVSASASAVGTAGLTYELNADGESYTVTGYNQELPSELIIPDTYNGKPVTVVGLGAFNDDTAARSIIIGDNVEVIEPYAFTDTYAKSITLPDGLREIGAGALSSLWTENIDIPDSVEYIGENGVMAQNYVEDNGYYYIDNWLVEAAVDDGPMNVQVLPGTVGLADGVIEYMDDETGSKFITLPDSVKYIGAKSLSGYAGVYLSEDNPYFEEKDGILYTENYERLIYASPSFVGGEVVIPAGVKGIDFLAFSNCENLISVTIPDSVTSFSNGLSHVLKIMADFEVENYTKPGIAFPFWNTYSDDPANVDIICSCISPAANYSFVRAITEEYGESFTYHNKKIIHNEVVIAGRDATCTVDGLTDGIRCDDCKVVLKPQSVIPGGHTYGEMKVYTAPTTTSTGMGRYTCEVCGEYKTVILAQVPETPKTGGANSVGGVTVTWNTVVGAKGYQLYRREAGSSTWVKLTTTTATQYIDKNVKNNQYYVYCAKAYNVDGAVSAYNSSMTKTVKVTSTPKLTSIQNVTNGVQIKWNAVSGVTNYRVYRRGAGSTSWTYLGDTKSTSYIDGKASSGNYWRYTVRAVNSGYYSGFDTNGLYIKRLVNPYSIKTANALNGVTVSWARINGATAYRVYRKAAGQSSWTYLGATSSTSYTDKNVVSGTYYKYTVRATSGNTYSWFNDGSLIRFLNAPVISGHTTTAKSLTVKWNKVTGASAYRVYRRGAGEGWKLVATVSGTSYTDSKVVKNGYYRYTVRSVNGKYISGYDNNGYLLKFVPGSSSTSSTATSKPSTKKDIVAYYNKAINNAKKDAKNIVVNEVITENYNNICYAGNLTSTMQSVVASVFDSHEYPNETYESKAIEPYGRQANVDPAKVKSATITESGSNYIVKLVMNPQSNPRPGDGGVGSAVGVMTPEIWNENFKAPGASCKNTTIKYEEVVVTITVNKSTGKLQKITSFAGYVVDTDLSMGGSTVEFVLGLSEKYIISVNY